MLIKAERRRRIEVMERRRVSPVNEERCNRLMDTNPGAALCLLLNAGYTLEQIVTGDCPS